MLRVLKTYHPIFILQIILGIVFLFSGITKLVDSNNFAEALVNFKLLNDNLINIVKYILPLIEITLGVFIIFNFHSSLPSFISSLLLSFFTALITVKIFEGEEISCGCFGVLSSDKLDFLSVLRNVSLILIAIIVSTYYENLNAVQEKEELKKYGFIQKDRFKFPKVIFIYNLIFFLAAQDLIFALQNNGLKSRLALLINDHDILKKGDIVKPFELNTTENKKINVNYNPSLNKNTLLFFLKPTCSPCKLNLPNWVTLFNLIDSSQTRILPISIDDSKSTENYILNNSIPFPIFHTKAEEFLLNYKAFLTPQTVLIDKNARVVNVWKGILDKNSIDEVFNNIIKTEDSK